MNNFITRFFLRFACFVGVLIVVADYLPLTRDHIDIDSIPTAISIAIMLGFLNTFIRPILLLLFLPVNILTLGLFALSLNGFFFWFLSGVVDGFYVEDFIYGFGGAFLISFLSALINEFFGVRKGRPRRKRRYKHDDYYEDEDYYDDDYENEYYEDDDEDDEEDIRNDSTRKSSDSTED